MRDRIKASGSSLVLEIGCGTGNVLRHVRAVFSSSVVVGIDRYPEGLRYATKRLGGGLVAADVATPPFRTEADVVCMFDVLEHIPDDVGALRTVRSLLKRDGWLVLTVPLHPWLWSAFDDYSKHARRYTVQELESKVRSAGFEVAFASPFFGLLVPMMWLFRSGAQKNPADNFRVVPVVNAIVYRLLRIETAIVARWRRVPFGSSMVLIARSDGHDGP